MTENVENVGAQAAANARSEIAAEIARIKLAQAEQREIIKTQREAAMAALKAQREAYNAKREAHKAAEAEAREADKIKREAEKAQKAKARLAAEAEKAEKRQLREAEILARQRAKLESLQARISNPQVEQNGIARPKDGSKCADAWNLFDSLSNAKGGPVAIAEVLPAALAAELNEGNVRAEYSRWRRFHGIFGRVLAAKAD